MKKDKMFSSDFAKFRAEDARSHYMVSKMEAHKFVGFNQDDSENWMVLGPHVSEWIKRTMAIIEIEAGLHD